MDIRRRNFLRGRFSAKDAVVLMPWLRPGMDFHSVCTRCDDCQNACPEQIIGKDDNGYPQINFKKGECLFCGNCTRACSHDLFETDLSLSPWDYVATINTQCLAKNNIACQSCQDSCEQPAIKFQFALSKSPQPVIDLAACNGCGACVAICPTFAVAVVPPNLTQLSQEIANVG